MRTLLRIDWVGNIIFIASICSLLVGLVFGSALYPWSSWRVILPIVLGGLGWLGFHPYEWRHPKYCLEPSVPPRIFTNRTSAAGFSIVFVSSTLLQWVCFFWPFYFQALKASTPLQSGIYFTPYEAFLIITAAGAGAMLSKFGNYKVIHLLGFCLSIIGPGTPWVVQCFYPLFFRLLWLHYPNQMWLLRQECIHFYVALALSGESLFQALSSMHNSIANYPKSATLRFVKNWEPGVRINL